MTCAGPVRERIQMLLKNIRPLVFWPPFLLLLAVVAICLADHEAFLTFATHANNWILDTFSWLFSTATLVMVLTCAVAYFSPLSKVKIGGPDAQPLMSKWKWFAISLCTTVAAGILFWAAAEPLFHLHRPPESWHIVPNSAEAVIFSMSTMFLHWTLTPYAIYAVPSLVFALAYYNHNQPFSLSSTLSPILGKRAHGVFGDVVDAVCLYALVAGMAASLGSGILIMSGGFQHFTGTTSGPLVMGVIAAVIVGTFILSAASGLMKGIRILSDINIKIFFGFCFFIFIFGPSMFVLKTGFSGLLDYVTHFFQKSLFTETFSGDPWPKTWTTFYWANWLAWAPVTALFLGRLGRGYTVREFLQVNLIFPACFAMVWMSVFSGTSLYFDTTTGSSLYQLASEKGPELVIFRLFENYPLPGVLSGVFLFTVFMSYVTAADSNTEAMGGISSTGICPDSPSPGTPIKVIWGLTVGVVAWIMVSFSGIDGIKTLSNLGGLPALFLVMAINVVLIKFIYRSFQKKIK